MVDVNWSVGFSGLLGALIGVLFGPFSQGLAAEIFEGRKQKRHRLNLLSWLTDEATDLARPIRLDNQTLSPCPSFVSGKIALSDSRHLLKDEADLLQAIRITYERVELYLDLRNQLIEIRGGGTAHSQGGYLSRLADRLKNVQESAARLLSLMNSTQKVGAEQQAEPQK